MSTIINPDQNTLLRFEVDVSGSEEAPKPRLIIPISETVSLIFQGEMQENEVVVDVADLLELTNSKKFQGKLEVILEDSIFYPWEDTIIVKEKTKVRATKLKSSLKESKVKVSAKKSDKTTTEKPIMELKKKNLEAIFNDKL